MYPTTSDGYMSFQRNGRIGSHQSCHHFGKRAMSAVRRKGRNRRRERRRRKKRDEVAHMTCPHFSISIRSRYNKKSGSRGSAVRLRSLQNRIFFRTKSLPSRNSAWKRFARLQSRTSRHSSSWMTRVTTSLTDSSNRKGSLWNALSS